MNNAPVGGGGRERICRAVHHRRKGMVAAGQPSAAAICGALVAANIAAWGWAGMSLGGNPVLLGTALLAYTFGLRHAVDADHIAAIDNATRKLLETDREPRTTGLFFALGHATVVILAAGAIVLASTEARSAYAGWQPLAGLLSTTVSATCLFTLAIANGAILIGVFRPGSGPLPASPQRGLRSRLMQGLFRLVGKSWHMYPVGFLFGLGFDTASEIGLLGVSAAQVSNGLPLAVIVIFPVLFTAGMTLVDGMDGIAMAAAYRWASSQPLRKRRYNVAITSVSIVAATAIGCFELIGLFLGATIPFGAAGQ